MTTCPKCGAKLEPDWHFCMNCSAPVASPPTELPTPANAPSAEQSLTASPGSGGSPPASAPIAASVEPKFSFLRFVAKLLKILAVVEVAGAAIFGVSLAALGQPSPAFGGAGGALAGLLGLGGFFVALILGLLGGLYSWVAADFILVALAVEENTRAIRLSVK